jgi:hypothetical protein
MAMPLLPGRLCEGQTCYHTVRRGRACPDLAESSYERAESSQVNASAN